MRKLGTPKVATPTDGENLPTPSNSRAGQGNEFPGTEKALLGYAKAFPSPYNMEFPVAGCLRSSPANLRDHITVVTGCDENRIARLVTGEKMTIPGCTFRTRLAETVAQLSYAGESRFPDSCGTNSLRRYQHEYPATKKLVVRSETS